MDPVAVLFPAPGQIALQRVALLDPGPADVVVQVEWSGISTGTERLLHDGRMPAFPGLGYPLVPGYESVGRVVRAGPDSGRTEGERVFLPGSRGFRDVRGLFGGAAARVVSAGARAVPVRMGEEATLLALAATAHHAVAMGAPGLIIGQGVLGRLAARVSLALGHPPAVLWEADARRRAAGMTDPAADDARGHACILDCSGDAAILDAALPRLGMGGQVVLAGFYAGRVSFDFPAAFLREARIRVAAEWAPADLDAVLALIAAGRLSLDGLITHRAASDDAPAAYRTAFGDVACLKMVLDWRHSP